MTFRGFHHQFDAVRLSEVILEWNHHKASSVEIFKHNLAVFKKKEKNKKTEFLVFKLLN